jgi:hypothetical protein
MEFSSQVPAGVEIELENGTGTRESHPGQALYFTDVMADFQ